jgi:hypothetical protein
VESVYRVERDHPVNPIYIDKSPLTAIHSDETVLLLVRSLSSIEPIGPLK